MGKARLFPSHRGTIQVAVPAGVSSLSGSGGFRRGIVRRILLGNAGVPISDRGHIDVAVPANAGGLIGSTKCRAGTSMLTTVQTGTCIRPDRATCKSKLCGVMISGLNRIADTTGTIGDSVASLNVPKRSAICARPGCATHKAKLCGVTISTLNRISDITNVAGDSVATLNVPKRSAGD